VPGAFPMLSWSSPTGELVVTASSPMSSSTSQINSLAILALSAWCGLVAGLLEVAITVIRKKYFDADHFYGMGAEFIWLVPLVSFVFFSVLGLVLSQVVRWGRRAQKFATRTLATLALAPLFWAVFPRIYGAAGFLLMMGVALRLVPLIERHARSFGRVVHFSFPSAFCLLIGFALWSWTAGWISVRREAALPFPSSSCPNVLLIVLDTVAARHLSVLGYNRPTSPSIEELARRGISFTRARAAASWTLPSHASMFTGRWPHELSASWRTPLDQAFPTVAEYLGKNGYATAGFVGNVSYCAWDSGLARGFATYRDYYFPALTALHVSVIVDRLVDGLQDLDSFCTDRLSLPYLRAPADVAWQLFAQDRKGAAAVSQEFLGWLSSREWPDRPFFAFLNFYDAHHPYQLPPQGIHRFGTAPRTEGETAVIRHWPELVKLAPSAGQVTFARDAYDDCVADLDERLGELIDELEHRGVLERTWVILTADHGENFGEHPGVFLHGATLYQTETHVPLVIVPPSRVRRRQVVTVPVSLRDIAATIVDIAGLDTDSPFPGGSLIRAQEAPARGEATGGKDTSPAFAELANEIPPYVVTSEYDPALRWPLAALIDGDWSYFRRDGELRELLFNLRSDAGEQHDVAGDPALLATLERMRQELARLTNGRLTPDRFNP
jgi:arylsulfatase A-like enzyme